MRLLLNFLVLILLITMLIPAVVQAQDTPVHIVEAAIAAANADLPTLGRPTGWRHQILPQASDTALGCPIAVGTPLAAPVTPYKVWLVYDTVEYVVHVSADGQITQLCDRKFPSMAGGTPAPTAAPGTPQPTATLPPNTCLLTTIGAFSNVRTAPSLEGVVVTEIFENRTYRVYGMTADSSWYLIEEGWVSNTVSQVQGECFNLPILDASVSSGATVQYPCPPDWAGYMPPRIQLGDPTATVQQGGVPNRLRAEPTTLAEIVGEAQPGTGFNAILAGPACNEGFVWWRVDYGGIVAWTVESSGSTREYYLEPFRRDGTAAQPTTTAQPQPQPPPAASGSFGPPITTQNVNALGLVQTLPLDDARSIVWSPDGTQFAVFTTTGVQILTYPALENNPIQENAALNYQPTSTVVDATQFRGDALAFSFDGRYLAIGYVDGAIQVVDFESGRIAFLPQEHTAPISALAFHPSRNVLLSVSGRFENTTDWTLKLWDFDTLDMAAGTAAIVLNYSFPSPLQDVAFTSDGAYFAAISSSGLWAYSVETGELVHLQAITTDPAAMFITSTHPDWMDNGLSVFVFANDGAASQVDAVTAAESGFFSFEYLVGDVAFSPVVSTDGAVLYAVAGVSSGSPTGTELVNFYTDAQPGSFATIAADVVDMTFSADGTAFAIVTAGGTVQLYGVGQ